MIGAPVRGWWDALRPAQGVPPVVSHQPAFLHAEKVVAADDDVVEHIDTQDLTHLHQPTRQVEVVLAR